MELKEEYFNTEFLEREFFKKLIKRMDPNSKDFKVVEKSYEFAYEKHLGQKRLSGENYINHPLRTALNILDLNLDYETISGAILHDILEDTNVSYKELKDIFGENIAFLVDGVTKITSIKYQNKSIAELQKLSRFIIYFLDDIRVVFIKLADRLDNMRTLNFLDEEKRKKVAQETKEIYLPLSQKLGIFSWAGELDELCFKYLEPENYDFIKSLVEEKIKKGEDYLRNLIDRISKKLIENKINPVNIEYRVKRISSIWKKFLKKNSNIDHVYDILAIRIIVKSIEECYLVLGILHQMFNPIFEEFDDYIAFPKPNGYQSLHTTLFDENGEIIEIQIRTEKMHIYNEIGAAAYFAYAEFKNTKEYRKGGTFLISEREMKIVEKLRKWQEIENPKEFLKILKEEFFQDKILVFTPKGDIVELPIGSTPVDFAYKIHTEIGNHCVGAKVNNKIVPLNTELKTGDVVEIIVNKNKYPSQDWLYFVKTYQARKHIKNFIKRNINKELTEVIFEFENKENSKLLYPKIIQKISDENIYIYESNFKDKGDGSFLKLVLKGDIEKIKDLISKINSKFNLKGKIL
jgi:guanosine-3',5'-bis(diphosphate) 3'-pyrophosphohydrolase